jgi:glycosyltransferase involved in cell wall biosynthesis
MNVVFFHRKPKVNNFSVEGTFQIVRGAMSKDVKCVIAQSRYDSKGFFRRLYNICEAPFRQGDVNHITGDVHFLSYLLRRNKTLLTILDCVFMYNAKGIKRYILRLFWYVIPEKRVALISVISKSTKDELLKCLKCDPDKIRIVPVCISPAYKYSENEFNPNKPIILQVGTSQNKNILRLIEALQGIPCQLEIVGILSLDQKMALRQFNVEYRNYFNLSDADMVRKYHECDLVAFVSTYEGFGMPILEANAVGRAVITSNLLSMPEVAGDAACLVDPYNVTEIRAGILKIINDSLYREKLIYNGLNNVKRFDPQQIATQYVQLYKEIACNNIRNNTLIKIN